MNAIYLAATILNYSAVRCYTHDDVMVVHNIVCIVRVCQQYGDSFWQAMCNEETCEHNNTFGAQLR